MHLIKGILLCGKLELLTFTSEVSSLVSLR